MPELPEVEVVKRILAQNIINKTITRVEVNRTSLRLPIIENLSELLCNKNILNINRKGKYIIIDINNGYYLLIHLGMSGKLIYYQPNLDILYDKHNHVIIYFYNGSKLVFNDPRRFGLLLLLQRCELEKFFPYLGVDGLAGELNPEYLKNILKDRRVSIKQALMDARIVEGIGNIYASEILFDAKISPLKMAKDLDYDNCKKLCYSIKKVLLDAIEKGGSTLKDYKNPLGKSGKFQNKFNVYGKNNKMCINCNNYVIMIRQYSRSTYYCGYCQN